MALVYDKLWFRLAERGMKKRLEGACRNQSRFNSEIRKK